MARGSGRRVSVSILSFQKDVDHPSFAVEVTVSHRMGTAVAVLQRTYNQFRGLRTSDAVDAISLPHFPRRVLGSPTRAQSEERKIALEAWAKSLVAHEEALKLPDVVSFFGLAALEAKARENHEEELLAAAPHALNRKKKLLAAVKDRKTRHTVALQPKAVAVKRKATTADRNDSDSAGEKRGKRRAVDGSGEAAGRIDAGGAGGGSTADSGSRARVLRETMTE